jgi:hypothetical protein
MAKLLLGHVVDGPEVDLVWSGLQPEDDVALVEDDEENEARLLHPDDGG